MQAEQFCIPLRKTFPIHMGIGLLNCTHPSRRGKPASASTTHSAAVESVNDTKESLCELFPAIYHISESLTCKTGGFPSVRHNEVRVFNPSAQSNRHGPLSSINCKHEQEKRSNMISKCVRLKMQHSHH